MAKLNLTQAAKEVGVSRQTLHRYIKNGKISVDRDEFKNPLVDTSELLRVFGALQGDSNRDVPELHHVTPEKDTLLHHLQQEIQFLREQLEGERERVDQLMQELAEQSKRLLPAPPRRRGLMAWIRGK